jgi:hypothetical protein
MPVEKSLKAFTERRYNCAQSVLKGFQKHLDVDEEDILSARERGGGRAELGRCGALFEALNLAGDEKMKEQIMTAFEEKAGSQKCREIRKLKRLSCSECVKLAASLLKDKLV